MDIILSNSSGKPIYQQIANQVKEQVCSGALTAGEALPDFAKGQMVMHRAFGRGMILTITKMGGDALIEVAFDNVGTKRLMLKSAAAHMEKI